MKTSRRNILFIGGSLNQTSMMYQISLYFDDFNCYFTPYYSDGMLDFLAQNGVLDFTILAGDFKYQTEQFIMEHRLKIDYKGIKHEYDLVFTCQDLVIPKNIEKKKVILVQEGMTDPENLMYYLVRNLSFPRWMAGTSATGLSNKYAMFFVASEGYKELFIRKGVHPEKIFVTGIPNFDHAKQYTYNDFEFHDFVLAATSDRRETLNYENRKEFIQNTLKIADGRQLIFKLHPNEWKERAVREIERYAPNALIYQSGNINEMIANCSVLVTKYSSVVYIGIALGKEVISDFDILWLKSMCPIQNEGKSAYYIANAVREQILGETITGGNQILTSLN